MAWKQKSLGCKLRELRENYDLSQNQVAKALNIDRSTYTNYELDKTQPNLEAIVKLAQIFSIDKGLLLPELEGEDTSDFRESLKPDGMVKTLTKEERGLIVLYRSLDKEQRAELRRYIEGLHQKKS